jgi:hypothetical protein
MGFWWVCLNVGEIQVKGHQHSALYATAFEKDQVTRARELLIPDCVCFEPCIPKN